MLKLKYQERSLPSPAPPAPPLPEPAPPLPEPAPPLPAPQIVHDSIKPVNRRPRRERTIQNKVDTMTNTIEPAPAPAPASRGGGITGWIAATAATAATAFTGAMLSMASKRTQPVPRRKLQPISNPAQDAEFMDWAALY